MTPERFETLAEAYGGDIARWPAAEREAAAALATDRPAWARALLAEAGALDQALDALPAPTAGAALAGRILAAAPQARPAWGRWLVPAGIGAGLAAACAAGVITGAQMSARPAGDPESLVATLAGDDAALTSLLGEGA